MLEYGMHCLVPIKRVIDPTAKLYFEQNNTINLSKVKTSSNYFDDIALEAAVQQKEAGLISKITAISIDYETNDSILRTALAKGADESILLNTDTTLVPLNIAKVLHYFVLQLQIDLVIMGKQATDDDAKQTGAMLATLLNWPEASCCSKLNLTRNQLHAVKEMDHGNEEIICSLPAVITVDLRLNTPRYASLPNIMQAKKKPLTTISINDLPLKLMQHNKIIALNEPLQRGPVKLLNNVNELITLIKNTYE